jgi:hypothetical protein
MVVKIENSSFRDPSGFVFYEGKVCCRQINLVYKENYDALMESGLYKKLTEEGLLISHKEVLLDSPPFANAYKVIRPERIPFISYPYEWSFTQLKQAALVTLKILKHSLNHELILKDANAFNIQFYEGKPVLIDTLSFEKYHEGKPWVAYKQFCEHFLGPLALMSLRDIRLIRLFQEYINGIPLDLVSSLLPKKTYLNFYLIIHIHLHARYQKKYSEKPLARSAEKPMSRKSLLGFIDILESAVKQLNWGTKGNTWADYYQKCDHVPEFLEGKIKLVGSFLDILKSATLWDMGANTGVFSRLAQDKGMHVVSMDMSPDCVEANYRETVRKGEKNLLPLWIDLVNPSPAIGWGNKERMSLADRGPVDTVLALALIHHLAISNNVPLAKIANYFSSICQSLIIEFVPKTDRMAQQLLASRDDIFGDYTQDEFEKEFLRYFTIDGKEKIGDSGRILYLMKKIGSIK